MTSDELPQIGVPATRALAAAGVTQLSQLTAWTRRQLLELHGFGPRALAILEAALSERGLALLAEDGGGRRS